MFLSVYEYIIKNNKSRNYCGVNLVSWANTSHGMMVMVSVSPLSTMMSLHE
jgi:hypothetical protein